MDERRDDDKGNGEDGEQTTDYGSECDFDKPSMGSKGDVSTTNLHVGPTLAENDSGNDSYIRLHLWKEDAQYRETCASHDTNRPNHHHQPTPSSRRTISNVARYAHRRVASAANNYMISVDGWKNT
ncbi:hypothetical protein MBLNU459_g1212t1 [Dothideomycetes sp. NU459]